MKRKQLQVGWERERERDREHVSLLSALCIAMGRPVPSTMRLHDRFHDRPMQGLDLIVRLKEVHTNPGR